MNDQTYTEKNSFIDRVSLWILAGITFLVPVLVIPASIFPFQFSKTFIVLMGLIVLVILLLARTLKNNHVAIPMSPLLLTLWALPLAYLISAIFSTSPSLSFFGTRLETDTFGFAFLGALLVTTIVLLVGRTRILSVLLALLCAAWIIVLFQLMQVLFNAPLPLALFDNPTVNLIGRWNDVGVFAGLTAALSLIGYLAIPTKKFVWIFLVPLFFLSLFFMALVNILEVWVLFGLVALGVFVVVAPRLRTNITTGAFSLAGTLIAVFFVVYGAGVSAVMQDAFSITSLEVRPSFEGTLGVLQQSYAENPLVGPGPNTFSSVWLQYRPEGVLTTPFWNTSFNVGSGMVPTAFITGGALVALAWIAFSLMLIYTVIRTLFVAPPGGRMYAMTTVSGLGALYLLVMHYVYAPSQTLTWLLLILIAIFLLTLKDTPLMKMRTLSFNSAPARYALIFVSVITAVVSLVAFYGGATTYASTILHERGIQVANGGDLEQGRAFVEQALSLSEQDRYYRTVALIRLAEINQLIQENEDSDEARAAFQTALAGAIENTGRAVTLNPNSFENWITRSVVYTTVVPLQIEGAFENAQTTLEQARTLNPKSPEIDYQLALIHINENQPLQAREFITSALEKKANYTPAILLLAQLDLNEGNLDEAIESVRAAVFFEPNSPILLYQLGVLLLQNEEYEDAAIAFELALQNQPDFADAAFFLAQAYAFLDRVPDAAQLMTRISELNPDNEIAREFAEALSAGENPFDQGEVVPPPEEQLEEVQ